MLPVRPARAQESLLQPLLVSRRRGRLKRQIVEHSDHINESDGGNVSAATDPKFLGISETFGLTPRRQSVTMVKDPLLGADLGGVRIISVIGEGGMGRVYRGEQSRPRRLVAVKVIRHGTSDEKSLRRFLREAEVLGTLQHHGIAQIFTAGTFSDGQRDTPFVVMELVDAGMAITDYVRGNRLPLPDTLRLFVAVCRALGTAHAHGIVHRDIKPGNILVDRRGAVKVIDFGIAVSVVDDASARSLQTTFSDVVGTLQYMSPEQLVGATRGVDCRSDVYSLGLVLYELLVGKLPYDVTQMSLHEATRIICKRPVASLRRQTTHVPRGLIRVIDRCLRKSRTKRYANAGELAEAVDRIVVSDEAAAAFREGELIPAARGWPARHIRCVVGLGMAFVVLGVGSIFGPIPLRVGTKEMPAELVSSPTWVPHGDSLYLFSEEKGTLLEAIAASRSQNVSLLVIDDAAENEFVVSQLKGWTWMGLVNEFIASHEPGQEWKEFLSTGRGWSIVDDTRRPSYFNWQQGQPQGHLHEIGAAIHETGLWCDHFHTDKNFFCFEKKRPDPAQTNDMRMNPEK